MEDIKNKIKKILDENDDNLQEKIENVFYVPYDHSKTMEESFQLDIPLLMEKCEKISKKGLRYSNFTEELENTFSKREIVYLFYKALLMSNINQFE